MRAKTFLLIYLSLSGVLWGQESAKNNDFSQFAPGGSPVRITNPQSPLAIPATAPEYNTSQNNRTPSAEDIVTFKEGSVACLTEPDFVELMNHIINNEITLANALFEKSCAHFPNGGRYKILQTDYKDNNLNRFVQFSDIANETGSGAWTSIGFIKEIVEKAK